MSGTIHILHAGSDAKVAEAVRAALLVHRKAVMLAAAPVPLRRGDTPERFRRGDTIVVLVSRAAASGTIGRDLVQAQRDAIPVIPVRLENVEPDAAFAAVLGDQPMIDLFNGWNPGIGALLLALKPAPAPDAMFEAADPAFELRFRRRRRSPGQRLRAVLLPVLILAVVIAIPIVMIKRLGLLDRPPLTGLPLSEGLLQQTNPAIQEMTIKGNRAYDRQDYVEALRWYRIAASGNDPEAQTNLARLYAYGQGVPRDENQAMVWYRTAAMQGHPRAMNNIGVMYALGRGASRDEGEAMRWFHMAADRGSPHASYNIGVAYELGGGVTQSYTESLDWYKRAADKGYALAFTALAALHDNGRGMKQDHTEGLRLYIAGAERHDVAAMLALGTIYASGEGVEHNLDQSLFWFRKAAEDGNPDALFLIGTLDAADTLDAERAARGVAWIHRAASAGHETAREWIAAH